MHATIETQVEEKGRVGYEDVINIRVEKGLCMIEVEGTTFENEKMLVVGLLCCC